MAAELGFRPQGRSCPLRCGIFIPFVYSGLKMLTLSECWVRFNTHGVRSLLIPHGSIPSSF